MKVWIKIVNQHVLFLLGAHKAIPWKKVEKSFLTDKNPISPKFIDYLFSNASLITKERDNMFQKWCLTQGVSAFI